MSISVNGQPPSGHAHLRHRTDGAAASTGAKPASTTTAAVAGGAGVAAATAPATDPTGIQSFASELQSFLLSLQSGQPNAAQPAAAGSSGSGQSSPIASVADQLQHLLQDVTGAPAATGSAASTLPGSAAAAASAAGNSLQSVLDKLQSTLNQALQSYQAADAPAATTRIVS